MSRRILALSLAVIGLCLQSNLFAQEPEAPTAQAAGKTLILPTQWLGRWHGEVKNQAAGEAGQSFMMTLEVRPTKQADQLSWTITYDGAQGKSERPYRLVAVDAAKGQFIIDEQNGIRLDAVLIDNCLSSHFVVGGQRLWSTYRLQSTEAGPEIQFELMTADETGSDEIGRQRWRSRVTSLKTQSRQVAILRPAKNEAASGTSGLPAWTKLETEPYRGKQDDIFFINPEIGWYVNGAGKIFKTTNGGDSWVQQLHKPGTYFRCIAFVDEKLGFVGNIGPDYFPNVSDKTPLYQTTDGGETWTEVTTIEGPPIVGLCAMQVLKEKFVNAGQLDERTRIIGVGRVGGPTAMIVSDDLGKTWQQISIAEHAAMAFDVHFFNRNEGIIAAATNADVAQSNALILSTSDGGKTWTKPWKSERPFELTWKISFPTREVGYVTISLTTQIHPCGSICGKDCRWRKDVVRSETRQRRQGSRVRHRVSRRTNGLGRSHAEWFPDNGRRNDLVQSRHGQRGEQDPSSEVPRLREGFRHRHSCASTHYDCSKSRQRVTSPKRETNLSPDKTDPRQGFKTFVRRSVCQGSVVRSKLSERCESLL